MTTPKPKKRPAKFTTTALAWFPHVPATENSIIDMASACQIALRQRLRNHYWVNECRPLTSVAVSQARRKMTLINARDTMEDVEVEEVMSEHYGFLQVPGGWAIPDLDEGREMARQSADATSQRASYAGRLSALKKKATRENRTVTEAEIEALQAEVYGGAGPGPMAATDADDF